jgi:hypothetical protein
VPTTTADNSGTRDGILIMVQVGEFQKSLQYNDSYALFFHGEGVTVRSGPESNQITVIDEIGKCEETTYIFEERDFRFWVVHVYNQKLEKRDNVPQERHLAFSFAETETVPGTNIEKMTAVWNVYQPSCTDVFTVIERTQDGSRYKHFCKDNSDLTQWNDITTETEYTIMRRNGAFFVRKPNETLCRLRVLLTTMRRE